MISRRVDLGTHVRDGDIRGLAGRIAGRIRERTSPRILPPPCPEAVAGLVDGARRMLFPCHSIADRSGLEAELESKLAVFRADLSHQIDRALASECHESCPGASAEGLADALLEKLPELQILLEADVLAAYHGDPALHCTEEAILCYPGILAVLCHRLAHALHELHVPLLPRMISAYAHSVTGIDIHPGARIGEGFFIDHGTGVVIGGTAIIGDRVRLYQGVTLGAKSFRTDENGMIRKGEPRHPIVEDDVVIYSWATVLGRITIGRGSVIGGNVWVTRDVPPGSLITQARVERASFSDGDGI